jgi:hypothetical protein
LAVVAVFVVGVGACASFVASRIHIGRQRLSPISISSDACPYLDPVHNLAVKLNDQWARALDGREPWPSFRSDLVTELPLLETALTSAQTHVPQRVASKLEVVVLDLRLGLAELPHAASFGDVLTPPGNRNSPVLDGVNALADASDLVGDVCGYRLAPSNPLTP